MPYIRLNGTRLYYEDTEHHQETIVFSHGLLWNTRLFDPQVAQLAGKYRCISFDHRGQGRSDTTGRKTISIEQLYHDAVGLIEALGVAPCHFVGLSMGGYVGMRIAARRPDLLKSVTLMATEAGPEQARKKRQYRSMNMVARAGALPLVVGRTMKIMFGQSFLQDESRKDDRRIYRERLLENKRTIHHAVSGVLERKSVLHEISGISVPTLVLRGTEDAAIPREGAKMLAERAPGAEFVEIPEAGHTLTLENAMATNQVLVDFLDQHRDQ